MLEADKTLPGGLPLDRSVDRVTGSNVRQLGDPHPQAFPVGLPGGGSFQLRDPSLTGGPPAPKRVRAGPAKVFARSSSALLN